MAVLQIFDFCPFDISWVSMRYIIGFLEIFDVFLEIFDGFLEIFDGFP